MACWTRCATGGSLERPRKSGGTWQLSGPGWHTFQLRNTDAVGGEVDLVDPATGGIYDEVVGFGPQTTITVPGHVAGTPAQLPVP
jgi:hypothetical protein